MAGTVSTLRPGSAWLYDHALPAGHSWESELLRLESTADLADRCLGANLAMDGRVSASGEAQWHGAVGSPTSLPEALNAQWIKQFVQPRPKVKFTGVGVRLPPKRGLTHVENFGSLLRRALGADAGRVSGLDSLVGDNTGVYGLVHGARDIAGVESLATQLSSGDEDDLREFVATMMLCIESQGPRPFWWATLTEEVMAYGSDAAALVSALGLGNFGQGDWLMVFDYTVADAGLLYRPTTLDSGGYAYHFPTSVESPCGLSMPLRTSEKPCTELLHHALPPHVAAECARPGLFKLGRSWSKDKVYADLPDCRNRQRYQLRGMPAQGHPWLDRHQHRI